MGLTQYDGAFYDRFVDEVRSSAALVVPVVMQLVAPRSVVDIGCGVGGWLAAFGEHGVADLLGIDGDYLPRDRLLIPQSLFRPMDLSAPFTLDRRHDLAVSLEVAEHLPGPSAAGFVRSVTAAADVVLFSAAIPRQGGTTHINEQWQEYWRGQFAAMGYAAVDAIRPAVFGMPQVAAHYQQNMLLYVAKSRLADYPALQPVPDGRSIDLVHPRYYRERITEVPTLGMLARDLPRALLNSVRYHTGNSRR